MRYVIYGAGGIGGAIGARLHQHGHDVVLIARGRHLEVMQRDGIHLRAPGEDVRISVDAVGHPSEVDWRGDEVVILTMKSQDTTAALDDLRAAAGSSVPVVCAQNGVTNEHMAARRFEHVYAMLVQMPATYLEAGKVISHAAPRTGVLDAGCFPTGADETIRNVCAGLESSRFGSNPDPKVMRLKYRKLLSNLQNAVQIVCGLGADTALLLDMLRSEARTIYAAAGIDCATDEEFAARSNTLNRIGVHGTDRGGGSTWQSIIRGNTSIETDYLNGEFVYLGNLHDVPAPTNRALQDLAWRVVRERIEPGLISPHDVITLASEYGATPPDSA